MNEVPHNLSELEAFCVPLNLYLKPYARITITVRLPQLKQPGQSISNWDLMEKIKKALNPIQLSSIRVMNSTIEIVRFEAELASRKVMSKVIKALEGYPLKVVGFFESLKVRAAEAKSNFPTRHDWDEFFRNAEEMDELKPGERPDTIYLAKVPSNWFTDKDGEPNMPSAKVLRQVFEQFGKIRCIDIPLLDQYRKHMPPEISGVQTGFSFGQEIFFEAYVQFYEYISFLRAMDTLRNMKLVKIMDDSRMFEAAIRVDFDKTKHLSEENIQKRELERKKLKDEEKKKIEENDRRRSEEEKRKRREEQERKNRRKEREEKRRVKQVEKTNMAEKKVMNKKIVEERIKEVEKRKNVQCKRLLKELFSQIALKVPNGAVVESGEKLSLSIFDDTETLEARLRQALLKEQELRIRKRIEAKMLLKAKERKSDQLEKNSDAETIARRPRKRSVSDDFS